MSEAYRVKRYHHVSPSKHKRLLDQNLVPLLDKFPGNLLPTEEIDDIMSSPDALQLAVEEFDQYEAQIEVIQNLLSGDWLIEYNGDKYPLYLYKIKRYRYEPHVHLYIKHFAEIEHVFNVKASVIPQEALEMILRAEHLSTLPLSISRMLEKYEALVHARNERAKQKQLEAEQRKQEQAKRSRSTNVSIRARKRRQSVNGPVIITKAAFRNSKGKPIQKLNLLSFTRSEYTGRSIARLGKKQSS